MLLSQVKARQTKFAMDAQVRIQRTVSVHGEKFVSYVPFSRRHKE
ncbi:hypothetical protein OKW37_000034 [Paraburkholderia sp. MM5482-R2]